MKQQHSPRRGAKLQAVSRQENRWMLSEADGRELAIALLRELRAHGDACTIDPQDREPGAPQLVEPLLRYLEQLHQAKNPALARGFSAVLSDFLTLCLTGCVPDPEYYESLERKGIFNG